MATIIPHSRTILSVFPLNVEHTALHNGIIKYEHPAAARDAIHERVYNPERLSTSDPGRVPAGTPMYTDTVTPCETNAGYTLIRVYDTFTWSRDFTQDSERYIPHPLSATELAQSLVTTWATGMVEANGGMGPGIAMIEGDTPTPAELAAVRGKQVNYARVLINAAKVYYSQDKVKEISDLHRAMAVWMGVQNVPWLVELQQVEMKSCRACGERIRASALRCKECNVDLVKFYREHDFIPDPLEDPAVFAFMEKATAKVSPKFPNKAA